MTVNAFKDFLRFISKPFAITEIKFEDNKGVIYDYFMTRYDADSNTLTLKLYGGKDNGTKES